MYKDWYEVFPEIALIKDKQLQAQIVEVSDEALKIGGWTLDDLDVLPFTLIIPNTVVSYRTHVQAVTRTAEKAYWEFYKSYGERCNINYDYLIAGGILHDIGKLIEYEKDSNGKIVKSKLGKNLRHPFSGVGIAMQKKLPYER